MGRQWHRLRRAASCRPSGEKARSLTISVSPLNVAGSRERRPDGEVTVSEFERMMPLNLLSVILGSKHAVRAMLRTGGGSIINFSSAGAMNSAKSFGRILTFYELGFR